MLNTVIGLPLINMPASPVTIVKPLRRPLGWRPIFWRMCLLSMAGVLLGIVWTRPRPPVWERELPWPHRQWFHGWLNEDQLAIARVDRVPDSETQVSLVILAR